MRVNRSMSRCVIEELQEEELKDRYLGEVM